MRISIGTEWRCGLLLLVMGLTLALWISIPQASYSAEAEENEQKVTLDQTPAAVQETIKRETAGGSIQEIEKETEDGKTVFEAEFTKDGKEFELKVAEDGKVLGVEEEGKDEDEAEAEKDEEYEDEIEVTFEDTAVGEVPKGCLISESHGQGKKATWKVMEIEGAPSGKKVFALAETTNSGDTLNLAIAQDIRAKDLKLSVELKPISGSANLGGGLLWRAKDANNYYLCLWNTVKEELSVGLVRDGNQAYLESVRVKADLQAWHEIGIKMISGRIKVEFDDKTVIEMKEDHLLGEGNVGVLTQGDAATAFDNFEVEEMEKER